MCTRGPCCSLLLSNYLFCLVAVVVAEIVRCCQCCCCSKPCAGNRRKFRMAKTALPAFQADRARRTVLNRCADLCRCADGRAFAVQAGPGQGPPGCRRSPEAEAFDGGPQVSLQKRCLGKLQLFSLGRTLSSTSKRSFPNIIQGISMIVSTIIFTLPFHGYMHTCNALKATCYCGPCQTFI